MCLQMAGSSIENKGSQWRQQVQNLVDQIDCCIKNRDDDGLTLQALAAKEGYSHYHLSRKFKQLAGISLRDYLRARRLAFALQEVRDTDSSFIDIATRYGFSSHEAFSRSFKARYGMTPRDYRRRPRPVTLRTKLNTFDRFLLGTGEAGMVSSTDKVKVYFATIDAHTFLHIKDYDSKGYFDFWQRQAKIPDRDCETIYAALGEVNAGSDYSGQIMAHLYEGSPDGEKTAEAYGLRLPADYGGVRPSQMDLIDIPQGDYLVFEYGSFDNDEEGRDNAGQELQAAIDGFDYSNTDYELDVTPGRVQYFMFDPSQFEKRILPVRRT